jgi:hypothetical protein
MWLVAIVEVKISFRNLPPILHVHYEGWDRSHDEFVSEDSARLSPLGTYTGRADLPRYERS